MKTGNETIIGKVLTDIPIGVPFVVRDTSIRGSEFICIRDTDTTFNTLSGTENGLDGFSNNLITSEHIIDWFDDCEEHSEIANKLCEHGQEGYCRMGCK